MTAAAQFNWLDSHGDDRPVIDPARRMRRLAAAAGVEADPPLPPIALTTFMATAQDRLNELAAAEDLPWHGPTALGAIGDHAIAIARLGPGAPRTILSIEELIGGGVHTILVAGATGSLQPDVTIGDLVVPTSALREEGTSLHYLPLEHEPRANGPATQALIQAAEASGRSLHAGRLWTTDAPYREFTGKVRAYAAEGVLGVDMETSALMTLAEYRGVDIGILLTVSDHVFDPDWQNIFGTDEYKANCRHMAGVLVAAARRLIADTSGD